MLALLAIEMILPVTFPCQHVTSAPQTLLVCHDCFPEFILFHCQWAPHPQAKDNLCLFLLPPSVVLLLHRVDAHGVFAESPA